MFCRWLLIIAVLAPLPGITGFAAAEGPVADMLFLYPERIQLKDGGYATADRGIMYVPLNRSDPNTEIIGVEVFRFKASSETPTPTPPLFRLHGGPVGVEHDSIVLC